LSGILNWALEGCADWLRNGLFFPEEVQVATQEYRDKMDVLADFLHECCEVNVPDEIASSELYKTYKIWCEENGERAVSQTKFSLMLEERDFVKEQRRDRNYWIGIRVKHA
jgi:putative DNA primase/helicase